MVVVESTGVGDEYGAFVVVVTLAVVEYTVGEEVGSVESDEEGELVTKEGADVVVIALVGGYVVDMLGGFVAYMDGFVDGADVVVVAVDVE